jgi:hypothetical protein
MRPAALGYYTEEVSCRRVARAPASGCVACNTSSVNFPFIRVVWLL